MSRCFPTISRFAVGLAALMAGLLGATGLAEANTPITHYSAVPSTSQAGGHPDVLFEFAVKNRLDQESQSPCNCEDAKDATVHLPTGFVGNPERDPPVHDRRLLRRRLPGRLGRSGRSKSTAGSLTFITPVYNLVPPPDVAGLTGVQALHPSTPRSSPALRPDGQRLRPRREGDVDLPRLLLPLAGLQAVLWGVPADPKHDPLRIDPTHNFGGCPAIGGKLLRRQRGPEHQRPEYGGSSHAAAFAPARFEQPADPVPPEPDHLRRTLSSELRSPLL